MLDIGCGGGLLAEAMAQPASFTAIDVTAKNVEVARLHSAQQNLAIDYRHCAAETLAAEGR